MMDTDLKIDIIRSVFEQNYPKETQWQIVKALRDFSKITPEIVETLSKFLQNREVDVWTHTGVALFLSQPGQAVSERVSLFCSILRNGELEASTRAEAAYCIMKLKQATAEVCRLLYDVTSDKKEPSRVRCFCITVLNQFDIASSQVVALLYQIAMDKEEETDIRNNSVWTLEQFRRADPDVIALLCNLVRDNSEDDALRARTAYLLRMRYLDSAEAFDTILMFIKDKDISVEHRLTGMIDLRTFDETPPAYLDLLRTVAQDKTVDVEIRCKAVATHKESGQHLRVLDL